MSSMREDGERRALADKMLRRLARNESWMPRAERVMEGGRGINAVWGSDSMKFIVTASAHGVLCVRDYPSMNLLYVACPLVSITTVGGTPDGHVLAYGMRSGDVEIRDLRFVRIKGHETTDAVKTLRHEGKVCSLWVEPTNEYIIVCSSLASGSHGPMGKVVIWRCPDAAAKKQCVSADPYSALDWEKMCEWDRPGLNSRFTGQHYMSGQVHCH